VLGGGKFRNGAITAAFVQIFNHEFHPYGRGVKLEISSREALEPLLENLEGLNAGASIGGGFQGPAAVGSVTFSVTDEAVLLITEYAVGAGEGFQFVSTGVDGSINLVTVGQELPDNFSGWMVKGSAGAVANLTSTIYAPNAILDPIAGHDPSNITAMLDLSVGGSAFIFAGEVRRETYVVFDR